MTSKTRAITKICRCAELTDTLNTWRNRFIIMIIIMLYYFEIFISCKDRCKSFQNITLNVKRFQRDETLNIKFSQDNPQNIFLNFLTSKKIFIILQYSRDIFGICLKQTFVNCPLNILGTLLRDYWTLTKYQHLLLSKHTLLVQKQLSHGEIFEKNSRLKCFLNIPWMSRKLQRWRNTQEIFPEYYVPVGYE